MSGVSHRSQQTHCEPAQRAWLSPTWSCLPLATPAQLLLLRMNPFDNLSVLTAYGLVYAVMEFAKRRIVP